MLNLVIIDNLSQYRKHLFSALLIAAVVTPLAVTAGVYKWTDEDGTVHYGSQRPADASAERMKINEGGNTPYADENTAKDTKKEDTKNKAEPEKKPEATAPQTPEEPKLSRKEKKAQCQQARNRLQTIETRGRVRIRDEAGNTRHMTDTERSKELAAVRADVRKYCK